MTALVWPLVLMVVTAFSLCTVLEPWFLAWAGNRTESRNVLQVALGDGRKLLASHFYTKADAYFHNGYHPTIYDASHDAEQPHMAGATAGEQTEEAPDFPGQAKDWIDAFGRNFYPSRHTHLGDEDCDENCPVCHPHHSGEHHGADKDEQTHHHQPPVNQTSRGEGLEREILPWLRLSAELDPQRVDTYVVASYWLRGKLGKPDEAEQFLREGLRANPGDYEILFELGSIYYENRKDAVRARSLWELALKRWRARESGQPAPNLFAYGTLLNHLAMLEREQSNYPQAIRYYTALKEVSPHPDRIQEWIDYLKTNGPPLKVGLRP